MRHECETACVMSAGRECTYNQEKTQDKQDEATKELPLNILKNSFTQSRVKTQPRLTATLSPTRELKAKVTHDLIAVSAVHTRLSTESRALLANHPRVVHVVLTEM